MKSSDDTQPKGVNQNAGGMKEQASRVRPSQLDFELEFYGRILERNPDYIDVLRVYASNLTAKGLYARGLETDRRLVHLRPNDPIAHYNLACSYALLSMIDAAISSLESSLKLGYHDLESLMHDPDLEHVRGDARLGRLLSRYLKTSKQRRKAH